MGKLAASVLTADPGAIYYLFLSGSEDYVRGARVDQFMMSLVTPQDPKMSL